MTEQTRDAGEIAAALAQFRELGGEEFVAEMVALLETQTTQQIAEIERALSINDVDTAQRHAHSMKSTFGSFGARVCQRVATEMDLMAKERRLSDFAALFDKLKSEFAWLLQLLREL